LRRLKRWWRRTRPYVLGGVVYALARIIAMTLRVTVVNREKRQAVSGGVIYCGWHGKTFLPANHLRGTGVYALFSLSNDGELQSRIFRRFGFRVIRGSTGREGARAAIEAIRVLREGGCMAVTPDGPKGPAEKAQMGVVLMAKKSGAWLMPGGSAARPCWRVPTWDRYMVPAPLAKVAIVYGDPISVPADADDAALEAIRMKLEQAIAEADALAETLVGNRPSAVPARAGRGASSSI
jgi:lysophospholipid acyltransferase (LPLAT)-like uncharacterized protein